MEIISEIKELKEEIEKINIEIAKLRDAELTILQAVHRLILESKGERKK